MPASIYTSYHRAMGVRYLWYVPASSDVDLQHADRLKNNKHLGNKTLPIHAAFLAELSTQKQNSAHLEEHKQEL